MVGDVHDKKTGELVYKSPEPVEDKLIRALETALFELKSGRKVRGSRTAVSLDTENGKVLGVHIDISFAP